MMPLETPGMIEPSTDSSRRIPAHRKPAAISRHVGFGRGGLPSPHVHLVTTTARIQDYFPIFDSDGIDLHA